MDRLSFVFSLLLIISVTTTFGSVIKGKKPTEEELEKLLPNPDVSVYSENRSAELAKGLFGVHYGKFFSIVIINKSNFKWVKPSIVFFLGIGGLLPDGDLDQGGVLFYEVTLGRRVAGVLTYYVPDMDKTIAVRWSSSSSVSRAYESENSWNIRLYDGDSKADSYKFIDMNHNQVPFKADAWRVLSSGLKVRGYMLPFMLVIHVSS